MTPLMHPEYCTPEQVNYVTEIIMSIKPQFVDRILSGRKTVELRKPTARLAAGTRTLIYASSPRCAVVGEAEIRRRHQLPLNELWRRFGAQAAITEEAFNAYFDGSTEGVAFELRGVKRYEEPLSLAELRRLGDGFRPPQSYMRLPAFLARLAEGRAQWSITSHREAVCGM
ncbi:MAG: ASCH domain-containing protein [Myxococcales bacterium]|nr:ASCH domain-containing protein [Myxococcales bacterium]